jgi:hypothetical protein
VSQVFDCNGGEGGMLRRLRGLPFGLSLCSSELAPLGSTLFSGSNPS